MMSLTGRGAFLAALPVIPGSERRAVSPIQEAQLRWVVEEGVFPENVPLAFALRGLLSIECLGKALDGLVCRHDALRASFATANQGFVQVRPHRVTVPIRVIDVASATQQDIANLRRDEFHRAFDLSKAPLMRITVLRIDEDDHVLLLTTNQLVVDAWSLNIMVSEIGAIYDAALLGRPHDLEPVASFADIADWERDHMGEARDYWRRELANAPFRLDIESGVPGALDASAGRNDFRYHSFHLDRATIEAVDELASRSGGTLFSALFTATALLFGGTFGRSEVVFATPSHGRVRSDSHGVIGCLYRPIFLRLRLTRDSTFADLVKKTFSTSVRATLHQVYPVAEYAEHLYRTSWFEFHTFAQLPLALRGINVEPLSVEPSPKQFMVFPADHEDLFCPLDTYIYPSTDRTAEVTFGYKASVFAESTILGLEHGLTDLLSLVAKRPSFTISDLMGDGLGQRL